MSISRKAILIFNLSMLGLLHGQNEENLFTPEKMKQFADHLFRQGDYPTAAAEYERFTFLTGDAIDSILFKIGLCHQLSDNHNLAIEAFQRAGNASRRTVPDSLLRLAVLYSYYQLEKWAEIKEITPANDEEFYFYYFALAMNNAGALSEDFFNTVVDESLRKSLWELEGAREGLTGKSPAIAAVLSAFLPGLGKMYYGRAGDGLFSLGATSFSGFVSYMAFRKDRNISGLVTLGMTVSFYLGTIYGSYVGAELHNQRMYLDWKTELKKFNPIERNAYWEAWL